MPEGQFGVFPGAFFQCKDSLRSEDALEARLGRGIKFGRISYLEARAASESLMVGVAPAAMAWRRI